VLGLGRNIKGRNIRAFPQDCRDGFSSERLIVND